MSRLFYLDNLRSFALLLGIVFHAAIVYAPKIGYAIQNSIRVEPFGFFCYWIHSFRMPLFFIISGYFSALVWKKKGAYPYIDGRIKRILVPLVFGLILFAPIQYYLLEKLQNPNLSFLHYLPSFFTGSGFGQSHIWFLVDLFLFSLLFISIPESLFIKLAIVIPKKQSFWILPLTVLTFSMTLLAHAFFSRGEHIFGIDKLIFIYQASFFLSGILAFHSGTIFKFEEAISALQIFNWVLVGFILFIFFYRLDSKDHLWMPYYYGGEFTRALHLLLWCLSPFIWCRIFVIIFQKWLNVTNHFTRYLVESSLPIYILHHPISLSIAYLIRPLDLSIGTKFTVQIVVVLAVSFLIYDSLIKNSIIMRKLFGLK